MFLFKRFWSTHLPNMSVCHVLPMTHAMHNLLTSHMFAPQVPAAVNPSINKRKADFQQQILNWLRPLKYGLQIRLLNVLALLPISNYCPTKLQCVVLGLIKFCMDACESTFFSASGKLLIRHTAWWFGTFHSLHPKLRRPKLQGLQGVATKEVMICDRSLRLNETEHSYQTGWFRCHRVLGLFKTILELKKIRKEEHHATDVSQDIAFQNAPVSLIAHEKVFNASLCHWSAQNNKGWAGASHPNQCTWHCTG